jgi:hypothetical protein
MSKKTWFSGRVVGIKVLAATDARVLGFDDEDPDVDTLTEDLDVE